MVLELRVIKENMIRFLRLLIAMGLTWGVEICKGIHSHFDDSNDNSTFGKILNFLNLLNVFLVINVLQIFTKSTIKGVSVRLMLYTLLFQGPFVFFALINGKARKHFLERYKEHKMQSDMPMN